MDTRSRATCFTRVAAAGEMLGVDARVPRAALARAGRLPPLQIGRHGQLQEWLEDYDEPDPATATSRTCSRSTRATRSPCAARPSWRARRRVTLELRLADGGGHTGWSRAWNINFWARLEDGEHAHASI